ncbi:MAG: LacI family transcriptional regulator [bacterium]|nr:LacI family transcriptional regulator [bacterium]
MTMEEEKRDLKKMTIADVAEALGVSKTTVSRVISGKGRIGNDTKERVLRYIEEHDYKPNVIAKGLAQNKTYNIGLMMPGSNNFADSSFFQKCMIGISETAAAADYDMVVSMIRENDLSQLERLVLNNKVDGIILSRTLVEDAPAAYLKQHHMPFVAIGTSPDPDMIQIDHDHREACRELTSILLMKGLRRVALIGGGRGIVITNTRMQGYLDAFEAQELPVDSSLICLDADNEPMLERMVSEFVKKGVECILCMDDAICCQVLNALKKKRLNVPEDLRVASFYNSPLLDNNLPAITSLQFDAAALGAVTCRILLDHLEGKAVAKRTLLGYEVVLKESTK